MDHSVLVNWVWQYFTGEGKPKKDGTTAAGVTAGNMAAAKLSGGEAISPDTALGPRQLPHPASSSSSSSPEEEPLVDDRSGPVMLSREEPLSPGCQACRVRGVGFRVFLEFQGIEVLGFCEFAPPRLRLVQRKT